MVKTWSSAESGDVTCEACGSVYSVTTHRLPAKDRDSFNCIVCGNTMHTWNDTMFPSFELKQRGKLPSNKTD